MMTLLVLSAAASWAQEGGAPTLDEVHRLIAAGKDDAALTEIATLRTTAPAIKGLDRAEGDALYDEGKLPEAAAAYGRALEADAHDTAAGQMRGLTLFRLGRPKEAIPLLEANRSYGAGSKADPSYVLALCYMDTLRYDDARHAFAAQYGVGGDSAAAYALTARMLLRREFVPVAKEYAEKAVALEPKLPLAHQLLGEIALAANQLDDAVRELEAERATDPLDGAAYERLGDAYTRGAHYAEAARVLQQAVLLEPNATGPYILLGKAMLKQNQPVDAMGFLAKAEAMDPSNYMTHNLLAQTYRALGRTADAVREGEMTEKLQASGGPAQAH